MRPSTKKPDFSDIKSVIHLQTGIDVPCVECDIKLSGADIEASIAHYEQRHSYRLLHRGLETQYGKDIAVVVLGRPLLVLVH